MAESDTGLDSFGNPLGNDVQGNNKDRNAEGEAPKDPEGNKAKDVFGNETGG